MRKAKCHTCAGCCVIMALLPIVRPNALMIVHDLQHAILITWLQTPRETCDVSDHVILVPDGIVCGAIAADENPFDLWLRIKLSRSFCVGLVRRVGQCLKR